MRGRRGERSGPCWNTGSKCVGGEGWQIRSLLTPRHEWEGLAHKLTVIRLPRKASKRDIRVTVPQTDTGRWGENPKVLEITLVKELGKMAP